MRLDKFVLAGCTAMLTCMTPALAQNVLKFNDDAVKVTTIGVAVDTVCLSYDSGVTPVTVMCNQTLTAAALDADGQAADWFRVRSVGADRVVIAQDYSYDNFEHTGVLRLTAEDGTTRDVPVVQAGNDAASTLQGDTKLIVASASDNQHQSGEDASASIDGDFSTLFHSPWSGSTFPVVLTYNFGTASHVDYAVRVHVHENRDVSIVSRPALLVYPDTSEIGEVQPVL